VSPEERDALAMLYVQLVQEVAASATLLQAAEELSREVRQLEDTKKG
jgi:hypothetical protein